MPVQDYDGGLIAPSGGAYGRRDDKPLAVGHDVVLLAHDRNRRQPGLKQLLWRRWDRSFGRYIDRDGQQRAVETDVKQLLSVLAPARLPSTIHPGLELRASMLLAEMKGRSDV